MRKDPPDSSNAPARLRPSFASALPVAFILRQLLAAVLICPLSKLGYVLIAEDLLPPEKMDKNSNDHGVNCAQHIGCCQFTDGESDQRQLNNPGIQIQAANGDFKRSQLKFQNKATSSHHAFLLSSRDILVRECVRLASAIRRAAAGCLAPSTGTDDDLPYMQLDKVTHAVRRETFGPLYLVT